VIDLSRQAAECFGYEGTPWNAFVPDYERGVTAADLQRILEPLRDATVKLLGRILERPKTPAGFLAQKWDIDRQREFGLRVARDLGYDMAAGRQDVSAHPFTTTIGYGDVRITTRYSEDNLLDALLATIHEAGHAMYDQGVDPRFARTPLHDGTSLGIHESQSRFWEVRIGHSRPFWQHYLPVLKQYFPGQLDGVELDDFYKAVNRVEPGFLRVESDEVSYNLHIILRFEIELKIFNGELDVADLPEAWNQTFERYFGFAVPDDSKGVLQDIHWSGGAFGYFPTYSLGNIYNAMLVEKMESDMPGMWDDVARGDFGAVLGWLREKIHRHGRVYLPAELIRQVTGRDITCEPIVSYLQEKYARIYGL
jgi:carboxypeptidase Taq